jgi:hypothetical protein
VVRSDQCRRSRLEAENTKRWCFHQKRLLFQHGLIFFNNFFLWKTFFYFLKELSPKFKLPPIVPPHSMQLIENKIINLRSFFDEDSISLIFVLRVGFESRFLKVWSSPQIIKILSIAKQFFRKSDSTFLIIFLSKFFKMFW